MKKLIATLVCLLAAATMALAINEDKPKGSQFFQEQNQDQVAQEQSYQGVVGPSGTVERDTRGPTPEGSLGSNDTRDTFAAAEAVRAKQSLRNADNMVKQASHRSSPLGLAFIALGIGFLVAIGAKTYLDKTCPGPSPAKKNAQF